MLKQTNFLHLIFNPYTPSECRDSRVGFVLNNIKRDKLMEEIDDRQEKLYMEDMQAREEAKRPKEKCTRCQGEGGIYGHDSVGEIVEVCPDCNGKGYFRCE